MSYANYSAATGLPRVSPNQTETFRTHIHRDKVVDNKTVVRKARIAKGGRIRARRFYATATFADPVGSPPENIVVSMPFTGNLYLTVVGATAGDAVVIQNPFVSGSAKQSIRISSGPDAGATLARSPGQITLTLTNGVSGVYVVSVRG
jgi:hypothetical protein